MATQCPGFKSNLQNKEPKERVIELKQDKSTIIKFRMHWEASGMHEKHPLPVHQASSLHGSVLESGVSQSTTSGSPKGVVLF